MLRTLGNLQQPLLALAEHGLTRWKPGPKPSTPAQPFEPIPATSKEELNRILDALNGRAQAWADTSPAERASLLRGCIEATLEAADEAAAAATGYKGSSGCGIGEELLAIAPIVSSLREYTETLEALAKGAPPRPLRLFRRPENDQWVAEVFPYGLQTLLFSGFYGELWLTPGCEPTQARCYREASACPPGVGLVLGAGNQTPVVALDILHLLISANQVVCCKMNPVNEVVGPYLRRFLQPLVDSGFVEFIYGAGKEGAAACNHPLISSVHLTGSAATYDAIVWQGRAKKGTPPFKKPVGAELGCVTPYIIVPGKFSESDLEYYADAVVSAMSTNAGHNCLKAEIVVTDAGWPQREAFLAALRQKLEETPARVAFYPGSGRKAAAFKRMFPDAEEFGAASQLDPKSGELVGVAAAGEGVDDGDVAPDIRRLPWLLKAGLSPDEAATVTENWCGVLQEVAIPDCGGDAAKFMPAAVQFANERCWGTLSCVVIAHPKVQKAHKAEFDQAIANLRYGSICINLPGVVGFGVTALAWGGFPGDSTPVDVGSGDCKVHNTMLFDHVQKSVLRGPWRMHPKPFFFTSHRNQENTARATMKFMANPRLATMSPLASEAVWG